MPTTLPLFSPGLPARIERVFDPLCLALTPEEAQALVQNVREHVGAVREAQRRNEFLDVGLVERMAGVLEGLLGDYEAFAPSHQALVAGAARYFVLGGDATPDTSSLLGFDDDILVLNYVLASIGCDDLRIET